MKNDQPDLHPLTAFRFFAALAVLGRHTYNWVSEIPGVPPPLLLFFREGASGVAFFFVLSGFILTYNYRSTFTKLSIPTAKKFYAARLARIGPVHLLTFLLFLPLAYHQILAEPLRWFLRAVVNITLTQSFVPIETYFFSYNAVSWSLSDELFFYAVFPLALWGLHAAGWDRLKPAVSVATSLWLFASVCVFLGQNYPKAIWLWYINPTFRLVDFLIGIALCHVFLELRKTSIANLNWKWATLLELGSLAPIAILLAFSSDLPLLLRRGVYYIPGFAALILVFAFQRGLLSRILSVKLFRYLGEASFSLYMFHATIIIIVNQYPQTLHLVGASPLARFLTVFMSSLIVSLCCLRWFEMPCRDRIKRWFASRHQPSSADPESSVLPFPARELSFPRQLAG